MWSSPITSLTAVIVAEEVGRKLKTQRSSQSFLNHDRVIRAKANSHGYPKGRPQLLWAFSMSGH